MKKQSKVLAAVIEPVQHIRSVDQIGALLQFGDDNTVQLKAGSNLTAPELVTYLSERVVKLGSESVRLANTLRLARMLPKVKEPTFTQAIVDGKPTSVQTGEREVDAYAWVMEKMKANSATSSAFQNIAYLVPAIDVKEANADVLPKNVSEYALKNALGWLKDKDVIDDKGKFKPGKSEIDPVVQKLKAGIGANKLSEELRQLRKPAPAATPTAPTVQAGDTPAKVALDIQLILGRVEKLNVSLGVDKVRSEITGSVRDLAKLAGFDMIPIPVEKK